MDSLLEILASETEKSFSTGLDFSDESAVSKASLKVLRHLEKYKIGPAVLSLLIVFAYPTKSREKMWQELKRTIRENRDA